MAGDDVSRAAAPARTLRQPGPPAAARIESLEGPALALEFALQPGLSLRDAIVAPLARAGLAGATVRIEHLDLQSLRYVRPALPPDERHAAFYSEPHAIDGPVRITLACATVGRKDGTPFVHCHALWNGDDGIEHGGHLHADQVVVAAPARVRAWGLPNVAMQADFDAETNFTLFHPVAVAPEGRAVAGGRRCAIARIRPNVDLLSGIESVCRAHGFAAATIRGSVGSLVGARFESGRRIDDIATEILVVDGRVEARDDGPGATLEIALIDPRGDVHRGRLRHGDNPVLICFELVVDEAPAGPAARRPNPTDSMKDIE